MFCYDDLREQQEWCFFFLFVLVLLQLSFIFPVTILFSICLLEENLLFLLWKENILSVADDIIKLQIKSQMLSYNLFLFLINYRVELM